MLPPPFDILPPESVLLGEYTRGARVFAQDDVARGPCWVRSGQVDLLRHTEAGAQVLLHRATTGETLAEASLFSTTYHCDAVAVSDSEVAVLDKATIVSLVRADPGFALDLMARLARQVQGYRRRLEILAIRSARERVLAALADQGQGGTAMAFAARIGLTHEATYRALSQLVAEGRVARIGRGQYRVANAQP
jgi:CRP/FNR family transcriptional regulator, dissimilatory nitrate respiration regulator